MTKTDAHKKAMIEALKKCLGIVSHACKMASVSRDQFYKWKKEDSVFADECEAIGDIVIDFAESELHKKIKAGDTTAIIFYLKTKGKKRGYVERQEIAAEIGGKQSVTLKIVRGGNIINAR